MVIYSGGTAVARGSYWDPRDGTRVTLQDQELLPGDRSRCYVKISPLALIVFAPLLGLTFVLFLPLFGIGVLLIVCLLPLLSGLAAVAMTAMRVTTRISGTRTVRHAPLFKTYFTGARTRTGVKQQGPKRGGQQGR